MILCLDIGNSTVKAGVFSSNVLIEFHSIDRSNLDTELMELITKCKPDIAFISSVEKKSEGIIISLLGSMGLRYMKMDRSLLSLQISVDEPDQLGEDRIANSYGALSLFPSNDCLVIDIGTTLTFDLVTKEGIYLGGAIYPGVDICLKSLFEGTDLLPLISLEKPTSALGTSTISHIQSGIYYGLLGAIERISSEICLSANSPSSVKIVATGGLTKAKSNLLASLFCEDLKEVVDFIDPTLTITGIYEIFKEHLSKKQEK